MPIDYNKYPLERIVSPLIVAKRQIVEIIEQAEIGYDFCDMSENDPLYEQLKSIVDLAERAISNIEKTG